MQYEYNSYPTSYIPTSGSTATRSADTCNGSGTSAEFNDSEGVLFAEFSGVSSDLSSKRTMISDGGFNNRVSIGVHSVSNQLFYFITAGGVLAFSQAITVSDTEMFNKCAVKYKSGDSSLWINGFEVDTKTNTFSLSGLDTLAYTDGSLLNKFYGKSKQLMTFKTVLTDSELETLTSWDSFNAMAKGQLYSIG